MSGRRVTFLLGALALATALVLPAHALAGTYKVELCSPTANDTADLFEAAAPAGGLGFEVKRECGQPLGGERLLGGPGTVPNGKIPVGSGMLWGIASRRALRIDTLEADRSFSSPGGLWDPRFLWVLAIPGGAQVEHVGIDAPPPMHVSLPVGGSSLEGELSCVREEGCRVMQGVVEAEVDFKNIVVTVEDNSEPEITAFEPPVPAIPLRGTVQIPYEAADKGSGIRAISLSLDFVPGRGGTPVGEDLPSTGGQCKEPFERMVPCSLQVKSSISLDTTKIPDGLHTVTAFASDAPLNVAASRTALILVHNAPLATGRPALAGRAAVGQSLSVGNGQWEGAPTDFSYQWLRCATDAADNGEAGCSPIAGATGSSHVVGGGEVGQRLVAKVTATNAFGSEVAFSPRSDPVSGGKGGRGKAPQTKISRHPRRRTALRSARFSFSSDQAGSSFRCKLDKGKFKTCRSPFKHVVRSGPHSFMVRAVNSAGTVDPTPAKYRWRVSGRGSPRR